MKFRLTAAAAAAALLVGTGVAALAAPTMSNTQSSQPNMQAQSTMPDAQSAQNPASHNSNAPTTASSVASSEQIGNRNEMAATNALNALEAHGYADFTNFHRQGNEYAATVTQNGKPMNVIVNPSTDSITSANS